MTALDNYKPRTAYLATCRACGENYGLQDSPITGESQRCYRCWRDGKEVKR